jgi:hypothetical protein
MRRQLDQTSFRRLTVRDRVTMPGNRKGVIQPGDVRENRLVLLPRGAPFPTRFENPDGHWKVFSLPFNAHKIFEANAKKDGNPRDAARPKPGD